MMLPSSWLPPESSRARLRAASIGHDDPAQPIDEQERIGDAFEDGLQFLGMAQDIVQRTQVLGSDPELSTEGHEQVALLGAEAFSGLR
jgi:hypothetical protein